MRGLVVAILSLSAALILWSWKALALDLVISTKWSAGAADLPLKAKAIKYVRVWRGRHVQQIGSICVLRPR
jgi:hypothetical protein